MEYIENRTAESKGLEAQSNELLTRAQIAEKLGVDQSTVARRMEKLGVVPVVPEKIGGDGKGGSTPALYNLNNFLVLQQQKEMQIRKKHDEAVQRAADNTAPEVKTRVMKDYVQQLMDDDSMESVEETMINAAGFIALLNKKLEKVKKVGDDKDEEIKNLKSENRVLKIELNRDTHWGTLEKYNERYNWGASRVQLAVLSRRLGKEYGDIRKQIVSLEHPDGTWTYPEEVISDSQMRFPHFWFDILGTD